MQRILSVSIASLVLASSIVLPAAAQSVAFDRCVQKAASDRQTNLRLGMPRTTADAIFSGMVFRCRRQHQAR